MRDFYDMGHAYKQSVNLVDHSSLSSQISNSVKGRYVSSVVLLLLINDQYLFSIFLLFSVSFFVPHHDPDPIPR